MALFLVVSVAAVAVIYIWGSRRSSATPNQRRLVSWGVLLSTLAIVGPNAFLLQSQQLPSSEKDFYQLLRIPPDASANTIRAARDHSLAILASKGYKHDDEPVVVLRQIGDSLSKRKWQYDHFGEFFVNGVAPHEESNLFQMTALSVITSLLGFVFAYVITFPRVFNQARPVSKKERKLNAFSQIVALWSLMIFGFELKQRLSGSTLQIFAGYYFLPYQLVQLSRRLYPAVITAAVMFSDWVYDDADDLLRYQIRGLYQLQQLLLRQTADLQQRLGVKNNTRPVAAQ